MGSNPTRPAHSPISKPAEELFAKLKPATLALMSFVVSLGVYSFLGVQLVFLIPSQIQSDTGYSFVASLVISMILAILTALYVYKFERE